MIICALPLPCIGARKPKTEDLNGSGSGLPFSTKGSPHVQNRFERRAAARAPLGRTLHGNFPGTYFRPAEKGWSSNMIEVKNLTKRYGTNTALNNVSFTVEEGTIVGFLGPNGAGKSTTMNIITGYLSATSGSVTVQGKNTLENPNEVKKLIGYLPELPPLYMDMSALRRLCSATRLSSFWTSPPSALTRSRSSRSATSSRASAETTRLFCPPTSCPKCRPCASA